MANAGIATSQVVGFVKSVFNNFPASSATPLKIFSNASNLLSDFPTFLIPSAISSAEPLSKLALFADSKISAARFGFNFKSASFFLASSMLSPSRELQILSKALPHSADPFVKSFNIFTYPPISPIFLRDYCVIIIKIVGLYNYRGETMALLKCNECGNNVSEHADKCPHCGCPIFIIKEISKQTNLHLITFINGKTIDLTGIEDKIPESELNSSRIWEILEKDYNASISTCSVVNSMFQFNNYKYPTNYQKLYEDMCELNKKRVNTNVPKCPTCGSTRIQKISASKKALGAFGFGLLSKTAKSQFECQNCGYKW